LLLAPLLLAPGRHCLVYPLCSDTILFSTLFFYPFFYGPFFLFSREKQN
jgi:hypothetical protein